MISVVMPYWRRPSALMRSLASYRMMYKSGVEIIVVDDGSPEPVPDINGVKMIRLPRKMHALNPCVPINVGVQNATSRVIVLTNPEVVHRAPILDAMLDQLSRLGQKGYVAASCWSERHNRWVCHSKLSPRRMVPEGAGFHFCAMMHRSLYDEVGGFDEDYRPGQGYEDQDFVWRLHLAGARFVIRDDLVTDHIVCPLTIWPPGGLARNRKLFVSRMTDLGLDVPPGV